MAIGMLGSVCGRVSLRFEVDELVLEKTCMCDCQAAGGDESPRRNVGARTRRLVLRL